MTLLLVRHASSVPPVPGGPDELTRPLSPEGLRQADRLADDLVAWRPARILSSPYLRAVQTVRPAADRLGPAVETRDALREWASGIGPTPEWQAHYRRCWAAPAYTAGDGETHDALTARAAAGLAAAFAEPGRVRQGRDRADPHESRTLLGAGHAEGGSSVNHACSTPISMPDRSQTSISPSGRPASSQTIARTGSGPSGSGTRGTAGGTSTSTIVGDPATTVAAAT